MTGILVVPIDDQVAKEARATMLSPDYGHPVWNDDIDGNAPCRLCLTMIKPGVERMILFTYDAFRGQEDIPLPGPVFVHERECTPYAETGTFPVEFRPLRLVFDAYHNGRQQLTERRVEGTDAEKELSTLLDQLEVDYVHVRSAEAGCYLFTVRAAGRRR